MKCALCGHEIRFDTCGLASVIEGNVVKEYCHGDDHSCYTAKTIDLSHGPWLKDLV